jgi:hypothetical protein
MIPGMNFKQSDQANRCQKNAASSKERKKSHGQGSKFKSGSQHHSSIQKQKQLYQQLQSLAGPSTEQMQHELLKNGYNLEQLNKMLFKILTNKGQSKSESGLRQRKGPGSSNSGNKKERKKSKGIVYQVRGSDQSPGSNESSQNGRPVNINIL